MATLTDLPAVNFFNISVLPLPANASPQERTARYQLILGRFSEGLQNVREMVAQNFNQVKENRSSAISLKDMGITVKQWDLDLIREKLITCLYDQGFGPEAVLAMRRCYLILKIEWTKAFAIRVASDFESKDPKSFEVMAFLLAYHFFDPSQSAHPFNDKNLRLKMLQDLAGMGVNGALDGLAFYAKNQSSPSDRYLDLSLLAVRGSQLARRELGNVLAMKRGELKPFEIPPRSKYETFFSLLSAEQKHQTNEALTQIIVDNGVTNNRPSFVEGLYLLSILLFIGADNPTELIVDFFKLMAFPNDLDLGLSLQDRITLLRIRVEMESPSSFEALLHMYGKGALGPDPLTLTGDERWAAIVELCQSFPHFASAFLPDFYAEEIETEGFTLPSLNDRILWLEREGFEKRNHHVYPLLVYLYSRSIFASQTISLSFEDRVAKLERLDEMGAQAASTLLEVFLDTPENEEIVGAPKNFDFEPLRARFEQRKELRQILKALNQAESVISYLQKHT